MVNDISIKVNSEEFTKALSDVSEKLIEIELERLKVASNYLKSEAVKEAPSDTGVLRASMVSRVEKRANQLVGLVGNTAFYSPFVHQGTGIYAKNGNGRKTPWFVSTIYKGRQVYFITKGQKPNPFLTRAQEKNTENIKRILGVK